MSEGNRLCALGLLDVFCSVPKSPTEPMKPPAVEPPTVLAKPLAKPAAELHAKQSKSQVNCESEDASCSLSLLL